MAHDSREPGRGPRAAAGEGRGGRRRSRDLRSPETPIRFYERRVRICVQKLCQSWRHPSIIFYYSSKESVCELVIGCQSNCRLGMPVKHPPAGSLSEYFPKASRRAEDLLRAASNEMPLPRWLVPHACTQMPPLRCLHSDASSTKRHFCIGRPRIPPPQPLM